MSNPHLIEVRNVKVIFIAEFMNPGVPVSLFLQCIELSLERTLHSPHGNIQDHMW